MDDSVLAVEPLSKTGILKGESKDKSKPKVIYRDRVRTVVKSPESDSVTMIKGTKKEKEAPAMTEEEGK
jgi:hypothetical protein